MRVPGRFLVWTRALSGSENLHKKKKKEEEKQICVMMRNESWVMTWSGPPSSIIFPNRYLDFDNRWILLTAVNFWCGGTPFDDLWWSFPFGHDGYSYKIICKKPILAIKLHHFLFAILQKDQRDSNTRVSIKLFEGRCVVFLFFYFFMKHSKEIL